MKQAELFRDCICSKTNTFFFLKDSRGETQYFLCTKTSQSFKKIIKTQESWAFTGRNFKEWKITILLMS